MEITTNMKNKPQQKKHRRGLEITQFYSPFHNLPLKWFSPKHMFMRHGKAGTSTIQ